MKEHELLNLVHDRLQSCFAIQKILLFGSRGRGTAKPDSDFDVLVIAETDIPFIERQGLALLALGARSFAIDLLVYTPQEAQKEADIPGSAVYWAMQEGREFHAV